MTGSTERWQVVEHLDKVRVTSTVASVSCEGAPVGWLVTTRIGPLTRRRWYLSHTSAEAAVERARNEVNLWVQAVREVTR